MANFLTWLVRKFSERGTNKQFRSISHFLTPQKFSELEKILGFQIKNQSHYIQALMHRSFLENNHFDHSNERLEFLGDSVLSLIVAEYLFDNFPDEDEGFLTKVRAKLVNRIALAESANRIELNKYLLVNPQLANRFTAASKTVLSDALEALLGAVYLDHGLETCRTFIRKILIEPNEENGDYLIDENYKSQLLEYSQANRLEAPFYQVVSEDGPQHERIFTIKVTVGTEISGVGKGRNKKSAVQKAAQMAMSKIHAS